MNDFTDLKQKFVSLGELIDEIQYDMVAFGQRHDGSRERIIRIIKSVEKASGYFDEARIELEIISQEEIA